MHQHKKLSLGERLPLLQKFSGLKELFQQFANKEFCSRPSREKFKIVCEALLLKIQQAEAPCFLLAALFDLIGKINAAKVTDEPFSLGQFELWLNHWSGLTKEENLKIRGKIVGRYIPRDDYQVFFPVGMGKIFPGAHFVAAHLSPDVDTTVSSFWGWVDAWGCRIAEGLHHWSLPSGLSDGHIQLFLKKIFGDEFFAIAPSEQQTITLNAQDLLTKREFFKIPHHQSVDSIELSTAEHAVVIVDDNGLYQGEWRSQDAEVIGQIVASFFNCLRWFESRCYARLINMLAKERVKEEDILEAYAVTLDLSLQNCPAITELPEKARNFVDAYIREVLLLEDGFKSTFRALFLQLDRLLKTSFHAFIDKCACIHSKDVFDQEGKTKVDRLHAIRLVEAAIKSMEKALERVQEEISRLSHVLEVKEKVLKMPSIFVTLKSDVDEMRSKIGHLDHLTVATRDRFGGWYPIGIVYADELRKQYLGTASLRDFSSVEETKMASYIDVISIVDHHKTRLTTSVPPSLLIGDAQSSNTLLGELSLSINRRYGQIFHKADELIESLEESIIEDETLRRKLLAALKLLPKGHDDYFVDSSRELAEYFSYIYAILDDTDLLTKVSKRDVICVKELLDRMRSIVEHAPVESVRFDHILLNDPDFVKKAAKLLLQSEDLHSIYAHMYEFKEQEVEGAIAALLEGKPSTFFLDTKEQNGCCRVGQAKLFLKNLPTFERHKASIMHTWQKQCEKIHQARPHVDFFLQMTSTITSADEVFHGQDAKWDHCDEIWVWVPTEIDAERHLVSFLNNFQGSGTVRDVSMSLEVGGPQAKELGQLCAHNFSTAIKITAKEKKEGPTILIFRFPAGTINSRKSQISPYLPKVVT